MPCFADKSLGGKTMVAPKMVYIIGEELTAHCMRLIRSLWIHPHVDTSAWEYYDMSCASRDASGDVVLLDAVAAGERICAIFKEPTVTPTRDQARSMGLSRQLLSPNGAMRRGWNGITISRDTIHIDGLKLGYQRPVLFDRHAVGGEYHAGYSMVGPGEVQITHTSHDGRCKVIDSRRLTDTLNALVVYHNPLDNVPDLARIFYDRCIAHNVTPYIVSKKTVFRWQEDFWQAMKRVFDIEYKQKFLDSGLLDSCGGELQHLISDAATMHIIRWTQGGFGMAAHNYDGDLLTDEISQVHRSPAFLTSTFVGKNSKGSLIKEFEASHGTAAAMWQSHLSGEETSLNPLGMVEALIGAIQHSVALNGGEPRELHAFASNIRKCVHLAFNSGLGTRDISGAQGLTTEGFIEVVGQLLRRTDTAFVISRIKSRAAASSSSSPRLSRL